MGKTGLLSSRRSAMILVSLSLLAFVYQNCGYVGHGFVAIGAPDELASTNQSFGYTDINQKIIQPKCVQCHTSGVHNFSTYATLMASGTVIAGNSGASSFYQDVASGRMPQGSAPLSSADAAAIAAWIDAGAPQQTLVAPTGTPPHAVNGLIAATAPAGSVVLTWTLPKDSITSVEVSRSTNSTGPFAVIKTLTGTATTFTDTSLNAGMSYYYHVRLLNEFGSSPDSSLVSAVAGAYSGQVPPTPTPTPNLMVGTFAWANATVFQPKCVSCHSGAGAPKGYDMTTYSKIMTLVIPGNSLSSKLYKVLISNSMPPNSPLTTTEKNGIKAWIDGGAANN